MDLTIESPTNNTIADNTIANIPIMKIIYPIIVNGTVRNSIIAYFKLYWVIFS